MIQLLSALYLMALALLPAGLFDPIPLVREVPQTALESFKQGQVYACGEYHPLSGIILIATPVGHCGLIDRVEEAAFVLAHERGHHHCVTVLRDFTEPCADHYAATLGFPRPTSW